MNETNVTIVERFEFDDAANLRITDSGFLVCAPRVARVGIQKYRGAEVGMPNHDEVSVYRPEDEVFSREALASFAHRPITNDHPPEFINADNWSRYARGQSGSDVVRDGDFIRVPLVLMDGATIQAVKDGKRQLSAGYSARLVWGAGVTPKGERYDAKQVSIRGNHIAVCDAARGGPMLRLGDSFRDGNAPNASLAAWDQERLAMADAWQQQPQPNSRPNASTQQNDPPAPLPVTDDLNVMRQRKVDAYDAAALRDSEAWRNP